MKSVNNYIDMISIDIESGQDQFDLGSRVGTSKVWLIEKHDGKPDTTWRIYNPFRNPDPTLPDVVNKVLSPENVVGAIIRRKGIRGLVEGKTTVLFTTEKNSDGRYSLRPKSLVS